MLGHADQYGVLDQDMLINMVGSTLWGSSYQDMLNIVGGPLWGSSYQDMLNMVAGTLWGSRPGHAIKYATTCLSICGSSYQDMPFMGF